MRMMVNNMSNEQWKNNFKRMLNSTGYDDSQDTVEKLLEGLVSMKTNNGVTILEYEDDKTFTIKSTPTADELMFVLFNRRRA